MAEWRALLGRGLDQLSPPEVEHTLLELPAERAEYVGLVRDLSGWPDRTPLQRRIPAEDEIAALNKLAGRWRAVVLLEDERALRLCATLFARTFVLDPLYDSGELLYAAWHDPSIKSEHARRLAEHGAQLMRAAPLLRDGSAVLAPDHLPGSWDPRPGWKKPRPEADEQAQRAWALRTAMVLLYWADRLDAIVVCSRADLVAALPTAVGRPSGSCAVTLSAPAPLQDAAPGRKKLAEAWARARRAARRRSRRALPELACACQRIAHAGEAHEQWQLILGKAQLADPALLLRRALNGQDPLKQPPLPPTALRRPPLGLLAEGGAE